MKIKQLLTKTLLIAALLMVGANAWADPTTLYEKGTTGHAWTSTDLDDWTFVGSDGQEINASGYLRFYKSTVARTEYTSTHSFTTTADYVVTMNLLWNVENANGSGTAGCYVKFGDVTLFWCGQNRDLKITIGDAETTLISGGNTNLRGTDFNVEISINKKTKSVSYSISNSLYNSGTPITGSGSSSTGDVSNVIFGWWRGGQQNASSQIVKSIVITEEEYSAPTANYTVHFVDNNSATVKADEVRNGEVGATVGASAADKATFIADGNKYVYSSDGGGTTVTNDGLAAFTVTYTKYVSTAYTVNAQVSGEDLTSLASGSAYFDGSTTEYWSKYIKVSNQWYETPAPYGVAITTAANNVAYTAYTANDIYDIIECENTTYSTAGDATGTGYSNGKSVLLAAGKAMATKSKIAAGIYDFSVYNTVRRANDDRLKLQYSTDGSSWNDVTTLTFPSNNAATQTAEKVVLAEDSYVRFLNDVEGQNSCHYFDYILIKQFVTKEITSAGWATYCSPYALDLANATGLTDAYIITGADPVTDVVTTVSVLGGTVPANKGLLLEGAAGTVTIPVVASSNTDVSANRLVGVTAETPDVAAGIYVLLNDYNGVGFYKTTNPFTVGANTAYLPAGFTGFSSSPAFYGFFDDSITGIKTIDHGQLTMDNCFDLQGRRVAQPTKGLYIVNGKKVVIK